MGSASKRVSSDIIKWSFTISKGVGLTEISNGYKMIENDLKLTLKELKSAGISDTEITVQPVNLWNTYGEGSQVIGYNLQQKINITSKDIERIEKLAVNPSVLYDQGIIITYSSIDFYISELSKLKVELLSNAIEDARARAEGIAKSSKTKIGRLISARSGVFQITEPYSTEVSDYGIYSVSTKEKDITITVHATFLIE